MKYKDLKINRVLLILACLSLPILATALNLSGEDSEAFAKNPPPPPTLTYPQLNPCQDIVSMPPITTNTNSSSSYQSSSPFLSLNPTTGVILVSVSPPGMYTITLTTPGPNGGFAQCVITIRALPSVAISGTTSVCDGASTTLIASGGGTYAWSPGPSSSFQYIYYPPLGSTTGNVTVFVTGTNGCTNSKSQVITVKKLPEVYTSVPLATACIGSTVNVSAFTIPADNSVTYSWTPGPLFGQTVTISPSAPFTQYIVTANLNNCSKQASIPVYGTATVNPTIGFAYITPLCTNSGNPFPIKATGFQTGGVFYADNFDIKINPNTGQINFANIQPGDYDISYSVAATPVGCIVAGVNTAVLTVNQGGDLVTNVGETTIEEGQSFTLGVTGGSFYNWDPPDFLSCFDCDAPIATPTATTRYCAMDVVDGCINHACTDITVVCVNNGEFAVPNAFTPNGDNNNEKFCLQGWSYCVTDFKVTIYDRWGEKVYESTEPNFCWDGVYKGTLLNSGVYVYTIAASINRNPISVKKGNITLIR